MKTEENAEQNIAVKPPQNGAPAGSGPSILNPQPSTDISAGPARQRRSAIARLPKATRLRINEMLDDCAGADEIIATLGDEGKGLNKDIIHRWKTGGYQDYLREQRLIEQCRARQTAALELLMKNNPINGFQATQQLATAQMCEVLADMGPELFRNALASNPQSLFRMLNSFARLTNGGLKCERHLLDEAERQQELAEESTPRKKGMSKEALAEMNDHLNLM